MSDDAKTPEDPELALSREMARYLDLRKQIHDKADARDRLQEEIDEAKAALDGVEASVTSGLLRFGGELAAAHGHIWSARMNYPVMGDAFPTLKVTPVAMVREFGVPPGK